MFLSVFSIIIIIIIQSSLQQVLSKYLSFSCLKHNFLNLRQTLRYVQRVAIFYYPLEQCFFSY